MACVAAYSCIQKKNCTRTMYSDMYIVHEHSRRCPTACLAILPLATARSTHTAGNIQTHYRRVVRMNTTYMASTRVQLQERTRETASRGACPEEEGKTNTYTPMSTIDFLVSKILEILIYTTRRQRDNNVTQHHNRELAVMHTTTSIVHAHRPDHT